MIKEDPGSNSFQQSETDERNGCSFVVGCPTLWRWYMLLLTSLVYAFAYLTRQRTIIARGVECGNGKEVRLADRQIANGVCVDLSHAKWRPGVVVGARSCADMDLIASQIGISSECP